MSPYRIRTVVFASLLTLLPAAIGADFNDTDYHEVVLFDWDTAHLDVLVLPPAAPYAPWRMTAIDQSIDAWEAGIAGLAPSPDWLTDGLEIVRYTPGTGAVPPAGFELDDPEIVILLSTEPGVLGIGIPTDFFVCDTFPWFSVPGAPGIPGGSALSPPSLDTILQKAHQHEDSSWAVYAGPICENSTENTCFVINTNWETDQRGMYDLNAHEFGHCLGIGHVGDAGDFSAANFPAQDIMSYQQTPSHVHCVSSLNIKALRVSFQDVLAGPAQTVEYPSWDPSFAYVKQKPGSYALFNCLNPTPAPIPDPDWFPLE